MMAIGSRDVIIFIRKWLDFGASFVLSFKNVDLSKTYRYIGYVYFSIAFVECCLMRPYNNPT